MNFKGEYEHTIDVKGRVFIPAKFRDSLGDEFVVCKSYLEKCLEVYTSQEFDKLNDKFKESALTNINEQIVQRYLYSNASDVELDKQGRALIPAKLREYAGLDIEVTIVGVRNKLEIWDRKAWSNRSSDDNALLKAIKNLEASGTKI